QQHVVRSLLKNRDRDQVQTLGGLAGSGKTVIVSALSDALPDFKVCALTGKAATVLLARGTKAGTIHSTIYEAIKRGMGVWLRLRQRSDIPCNGFLVDEASMICRDLYDDLLSFGLPIIFVGDHGQFPPIGDDVFLMATPRYKLETIHRNAGEIAQFGQHLRAGKPARSFAC